jgi:PHP family Zn ribbon phosphoesterase
MQPEQVRMIEHEKMEYTFVCPSCGDFIVKPADAKIVGLLTAAGVKWGTNRPPHPEAIPDPDAPTFTLDDLIDFHRQLEDL